MPGWAEQVLLQHGKGEESEFVSSGNDGMAAAVLSPGGLFLKKKKKEY